MCMLWESHRFNQGKQQKKPSQGVLPSFTRAKSGGKVVGLSQTIADWKDFLTQVSPTAGTPSRPTNEVIMKSNSFWTGFATWGICSFCCLQNFNWKQPRISKSTEAPWDRMASMISPWDVRFETVGEAAAIWVSHWFQLLSPMWTNTVCSWLAKGIPAKPSKPCLYWSNALDSKWEVFCHVACLFQSQQVEKLKDDLCKLGLSFHSFLRRLWLLQTSCQRLQASREWR